MGRADSVLVEIFFVEIVLERLKYFDKIYSRLL